jgi:hypothetical protein
MEATMADQDTHESQPDDPPQPSPETGQFDFWVGDWALSWDQDKRGTSHITRILNGHVILENFDGRPGTPLTGMSVSTYVAAMGQWQQTWVDNSGGYLDFVGAFADGQMILARDAVIDDKSVKQRMVWFNIGPDSLDWHWDRSEDDGATWTTLWALHYARNT